MQVRSDESRSAEVDLSQFSAGGFDRGAGRLKETVWLLVSYFLFRLCPLKLSSLKSAVLRLFGAKIGTGVVIKPKVTITFPWKLRVGDHAWIGEEAWILNLAPVDIGADVCISQRAFLCTGNHDYSKRSFDLITKPIRVENGAWIGAGAFVGPGVLVRTHAVLTAYAVAVDDLDAFGVYQGAPAKYVRRRVLVS